MRDDQNALRRAELELLQAQINPHFLYNTFDSIIWLAEAGKNREVVEMTTNLSVFFRNSLSKGRDIITLAAEKQQVESYLKIQKVRYRDILQYHINIPKELLDYTLPKLTLQPLVENALYHGIKNRRGMVATLILYTAGRGIAQLVTNGQITYVRVDAYKMWGSALPGLLFPVPVFFAIAVVLIVSLVLKKTALGLYIESVGINGNASRLVGLNGTKIKWITYIICGILAGIAGFVSSARIYSADANNIGLNLEMDAILAVALGGNILGGGKFSLAGSVIGAYTIQALTTTLYAMINAV